MSKELIKAIQEKNGHQVKTQIHDILSQKILERIHERKQEVANEYFNVERE